MMLDCSNAGSHDVPDMIPDEVIVIDLSNNALEKINNASFSNCTKVTKLDLSNNRISVIWNATLKSMPNLEIIVLDQNVFLLYTNSCFPDDTFASLLHLKSVSIWYYLLAGPESLEDYEFILQKLPHMLEELNVSIPGGDNISQPLSKFTNLKKLGIKGMSYTFNTITNDTFKFLENLTIEELTILAFNLQSVEPLAFYHLPELKSLNINGFHSMSVNNFYPALIGLQHTKLEKLQYASFYFPSPLNEYCYAQMALHFINHDMVVLSDSFCENLNLTRLIQLHLSHSRLYKVNSSSCFSKLLNLRVLNLSFNSFSACEIVKVSENLEMMENLTEINLSHQYDPTFVRSDVHFFSPVNLASLDLSFILTPSENTANFTLNFLSSTPKYLNFQSNSVKVLQAFGLETNSRIPLEADFSQNKMISFDGSFDEAILVYNLTVKSLILSENQLGNQLSERGDRIFKYFRDLTKLDLTSNDIKQLPYSTFERNTKLEHLNLSTNSLLLIDFKITHMINLKLLDLSYNLISQFNAKLQNDLDEVKSLSPNFTINMLGNPFQCSCETLSFLWWIYKQRLMFDRFDNYTCTHNGKITYFKNMAQLLTTMDSQCSLIFIEISAGLLAFLIFVIALSAFLYRHKWDVRFFCLRYVTDRKAYQEFEESEEEYEYDAFVSFHSDDQGWVWNELHENLGELEENHVGADNQPRFRFCIHERDFVPGDLIEENILRSIESSRKTIVVLSRNFLQSVWCEFELQIARKLCVDKGRDLIIAVMLEPLPTNIKITQSVERLVRKNTYIEWPIGPLERIQFWEKMRSALSK